jgi:alkylation response protein AidB-like acyl-CoA dehydrogenase
MLAENGIDRKRCELMIDWCAGALDTGAPGTSESSVVKIAVLETIFRVADRSVQVMGALGPFLVLSGARKSRLLRPAHRCAAAHVL